MAYCRVARGAVLSAWLLSLAFAAPSAKGESPAPECDSLEARASQQCFISQVTTGLYNLAQAIERLGNFKSARDAYSRAIASANWSIDLFLADTMPATALLHRGMMHRELGQSAGAMADFNALIDADKGNHEARYERARTLLALDRLNDALADIDLAVWLRPPTYDFYVLRGQILDRLGRHDDAAAALIEAEKYASGRKLDELSAVLKKIGPLTKKGVDELAADRESQRMELALRGIAPAFIRQRFLLQKECPDDDRHVLEIRLDAGRVSVTPSYAGPTGTMEVAESDDGLAFMLGARSCQVQVVLGKADLATDAPPAINRSLLKPVERPPVAEGVEHTFYPSPTPGCAHGSATAKVYWGSMDTSYLIRQPRFRVRSDQPPHRSKSNPPPHHSKLLLLKTEFGDADCRITLQIWKAA
jgi:tetratricopeptide (TPR) repeat protein